MARYRFKQWVDSNNNTTPLNPTRVVRNESPALVAEYEQISGGFSIPMEVIAVVAGTVVLGVIVMAVT